MQKKEAEKTIDGLMETRRGQATRLSFYLRLAGDQSKEIPGADEDWDDIQQAIEQPTNDDLRMTSNEKLEMDKADESMQLNNNATSIEMASVYIAAIPDITAQTQPLGCGVSVSAATSSISTSMGIAASVRRGDASHSSDQRMRASRKAQLIRQLQERRLQANIAGRDIKITDKQIATQQMRIAICEGDIKTQQKEIAHAAEMEEWLKSKYTSESLYAWMDSAVRTLFYQTYVLANELAKKCQRAYFFERAAEAASGTSFIDPGYWDTSRDGLLSAENLYLGLKRLESAYMEKAPYDFEIVKSISLRQVRPWALLQLREIGVAVFDLPEVLFDFDFPGQYCRRIKSVSLSVPCIAGPYTGINMTLSLLQHKYRVQDLSSGKYEQTEDSDPRFRTHRIPISSIAISHGQQDSGTFQLNFQDERYIPFEGAGAISTWRLELPTAVKQFDYNSITDVILHMRYTAVNGSLALKKAASDFVTSFQKSAEDLSISNGLCTMFDLKYDFANEWFGFMNASNPPAGTADDAPSQMALNDLVSRLPFWTKGRAVNAKAVSIAIGPSTTSGVARVDWSEELTLKANNTPIPLKRADDVGGYKVLTSSVSVNVPMGDWKLTSTVRGRKAAPEKMIMVVMYTV